MSMRAPDETMRELERSADRARERVARDVGVLRRSSRRAGRRVRRAARGSAGTLAALAAFGIMAAAVTRARPRRGAPRPYLANAALGLLGGLIAAPVLNQLAKGWSAVEGRVLPELDERAKARVGGEPATVKAAEALVGPVRDERRRFAGEVAHYAMSTVSGGAYGALSTAFPSLRAGGGLVYGTLVWLAADELLVPALGLGPSRAPLRTHARGLFSHLVYGALLEGVLRLGSSRLDER